MWRQHRAHRAGVNPAITVTANDAVDGTMIHAGAAADTAQHLTERAGQHFCAAIVDEYDMVFIGTVEVIDSFWAATESGIEKFGAARLTGMIDGVDVSIWREKGLLLGLASSP